LHNQCFNLTASFLVDGGLDARPLYVKICSFKLHFWKSLIEKISMHSLSNLIVRIKLIVFLLVHSSIILAQVKFQDDFNGDLSGWKLINEQFIKIIDSNDPEHGKVLSLQPNGNVLALVNNSEKWGAVSVEAQILFPDDKHNYLGLIYNYTQENSRNDYGNIYIKGNGSYIRVNPRRDGNVSRLLYEEYKIPLLGDQAIKINKWHNIKAEIFGNICHFYVGDMSTPKLTFDLFEKSSGMVGFEPRITGWPVWLDNVKVTSISKLSYSGPDIPMIKYDPDSLLVSWESIGPFKKHIEEIEQGWMSSKSEISIEGQVFNWKPFTTDKRGAIITGKLSEYAGERSVAYFRTTIPSDIHKTAILHFSTTDEISLWVNELFYGFIYRDGYISLPQNDWNAWYDFWKNPEHAGRKVPIELVPGENHILIRVKNGQFASGGFFVRNEIP